MTNGLEKAKKLTKAQANAPALSEWQLKALQFIGRLNRENLGAIMPYSELIRAADELNAMGLAEDRGGTSRRWLTPLGIARLQSIDTGGGGV